MPQMLEENKPSWMRSIKLSHVRRVQTSLVRGDGINCTVCAHDVVCCTKAPLQLLLQPCLWQTAGQRTLHPMAFPPAPSLPANLCLIAAWAR